MHFLCVGSAKADAPLHALAGGWFNMLHVCSSTAIITTNNIATARTTTSTTPIVIYKVFN